MTKWQGTNHEWSKKCATEHYMKRWDRTDFATLTLLLATETKTRLTFKGGRAGDS